MKSWRPNGWENPYPEPQLSREAYDKVFFDIYEAGADAMYEPAYKRGQRDLIERYKRENPSSYKKYQAYWDHLLEGVKE